MREREWKVYENDIPARDKARLKNVLDDYCDNGPSDLSPTDFKFMGHLSYSGVKVRMEEFKSAQVRLFGFLATFEDQLTFFVTGMDPAKKQQKADQKKLAAAVKEAVRITGLLKPKHQKGKKK